MWYNQYPVTIAGKDYVKETTRWTGHTKVVYNQIEHPQDIK